MADGRDGLLAARLDDRGFVELRGADAKPLLQGLVTNDVELLGPGRAIFAALLTPQGKYLFDFVMIDLGDAVLLDCERARAADLARRLMLYRLRAAVEISDVSDRWSVMALFGEDCHECLGTSGATGGAVLVRGRSRLIVDPRRPELGARLLSPAGLVPDTFDARSVDPALYHRHRIALAVPEGSVDLPVDKALILEASFEALNGVSFTKGCFVGQELTARMHYRALSKKMLVPVRFRAAPYPERGTAVMAGTEEAGELHGRSGDLALALLRRTFIGTDAALEAGGVPLQVLEPSLPTL